MMVGAIAGFGDCIVDSVGGLAVGAVEVMANTITSGDWNYKILEDGTAEITGHVEGEDLSGVLVMPSEIDGKIVTRIGYNSFAGYTGLTSIEIPNSVTSIGESAFQYCIGLTSIEIPNSVTSIGYYAFTNCSGLTNVEIPDSVTSIGGNAFAGCIGLTSIEIPNSVMRIEHEVFRFCTGLTSIKIPNSVTSIGVAIFNDCNALTDIYYTGTEDEWNAIEVDGSLNGNDILKTATIHYNSPLSTTSTTPTTQPAEIPQALPTAGTILVNGQATSFDAHSINDNNYFKLRDLAEVLKGDGKGFAIAWDGEKQAINMVTGGDYESVGTELAQGDGQAKGFTENSATILLDGAEVSMEAYIINDNTYFKLRDVCQLFDIGVTWNGDTQTIGIDTSISY